MNFEVNINKEIGEYTVTAVYENSEYEKHYEKHLLKVMSTKTIKGFRKGKMPRKMFLSHYGDSSFLPDVHHELLTEAVNGFVFESNKYFYDYEVLEFSAEKNEIKFIAFTTPQIEVKQFLNLEIPDTREYVTEELINKEIEIDLKKKGEYCLKETESVIGDTCVIEYEGFLDGEPIEGEKGTNQSVTLGNGDYFPEFEQNLIGLKPQDEKTFNVTVPENFEQKDLASKTIEYKIKVHEVKELQLPELNDEFVKTLEIENVNNVSEYQAYIEKRVSGYISKRNETHQSQETFAKLVEVNGPTELPEKFVEYLKDLQKEEMTEYAKKYNVEADMIANYYGFKDLDAFVEASLERIIQNGKIEVILSSITWNIFENQKDYPDFEATIEETKKANESSSEKVVKNELLTSIRAKVVEKILETVIYQKIDKE